MGNMPSKRTYLEVRNNTNSDITTKIRSVDNYDWGSANRPDYNFHGIKIKSKSTVRMPADINTGATANLFTMELIFENHQIITLRIDQGIASGRPENLIDTIPGGPVKSVLIDGAASLDPVPIARVVGAYARDVVVSQFKHEERNTLSAESNFETYAQLSIIGDDTVRVDVY